MSDLRELYQETILDHGKRPRNFGALDDADGTADGHNPLCGDRIRVYVKSDGDKILSVKFDGCGCAISTASASMMSEALPGMTHEQVRTLFDSFTELVRGGDTPVEALGKLRVFAGVQEFPMRVKCATLAWHTLRAALKAGEAPDQPVTTE
ncbi:MAG: SUF system NifU family Fe-S cluster assembly protein [Acidobacteriota bacterium]|nr:SUF system NifU family Fe-S cluster assembly protein [Acidobacteriota bacterium]